MFIKIKNKNINLQFIDCFSVENKSVLFSSINGYIHEVVCESKDEAKEIYDAISVIYTSGYISKKKDLIFNNGYTVQ